MKKRILSLITVFSMMTAVLPAYAENNSVSYSDVTSKTKYFDSIVNVSSIGIMQGLLNNTFAPEENVVRSEAAKMMVHIMGFEHIPNSDKAVFDDIPSHHWASGYIEKGVSMNVINGMGNNQFKPDSNVTFSQMVKMLVCILGYNSLEDFSYPDGYLEKGKELGITKDLNLDNDTPLKRAECAYLINNALYIPVCAVTGYDMVPQTDENGETTMIVKPIIEIQDGNGKSGAYETLLTLYHNLEK